MRAGEHVTPTVRLVRPIASGGMGAVWVAEHVALKTEVAVKFILGGRENDSEARERFSREAAAAAQVKSPHVTQIFDHGVTDDGTPFIVMELLEGEDLARHLASKGRLVLREAATIVSQICKALARAHAKGLIHRDVKPANIFLCDLGTNERFVKLLDFGVAKLLDGDPATATKSGSLTGTPVYMAPEQLIGARDLDHRADLWSVAVLAYELMVGRRPLAEENATAIGIRLHTRGMPRASEGFPELAADAARALDDWFAKAWAVSPDGRFQSALEMADSFEALVNEIYALQAVEPTERFYLPIRGASREDPSLVLTVREREGAAVSDVTLASGRLPLAGDASGPAASSSLGAPAASAARAPHTETPLSKNVSDRASAPAPEPLKRTSAARVAFVSVSLVAVVALFLVLRTRGEPGGTGGHAREPTAAPPAASQPAAPSVAPTVAPHATGSSTASAPSGAPSGGPSAAPASSPPPSVASSPPAPNGTKATAAPVLGAKKPPPAKSTASAPPPGKKLEDIE